MDRWPAGGAGGSGVGMGGGGGGGSGSGGRVDAVQLLGLAEKFLDAGDLVGGRKFAECAMEADPLIDGAERVLAAAKVLLAAQRRRINNHVDWYAILQLDVPPSGGSRDLSDVRLQYRRLALLLRPDGHLPYPSSSAAQEAFKLVSDAWAVLSNRMKKELYDKELAIAAAAHLAPSGGSVGEDDGGVDSGVRVSGEAEVEDDGSFWTACTNCCYLHQYERGCERRSILCPNCGKVFLATEMASPPPVVPGTDMYYCTWGLFPLGYPGGPNFGWRANTATGPEVGCDATGKPWSQTFFPVFPSGGGAQGQVAMGGWVNAEHGNGEPHVGSGNAGKKRMQGDVGVSENLSFSAANKAKPDCATMSEKAPQKKMRKKVMSKRPSRQIAGAVGRGVAASREEGMAVNQANKGNADIGDAGKLDGGDNAQNVDCSRTVEISSEDLDVNFSVDADAADNILNSLSTLPFLKDGEIVVVD